MANTSAARFQFIAHALAGDGPFRPAISYDGLGNPVSVATSYLIRYPRESIQKYARRCEVAFFTAPLSQAVSRFVGHLTGKPVFRDIGNPLLDGIAQDVDGRGNSADVFWQVFAQHAKARGSMLLLVDMPAQMPRTQGEQIAARATPYWASIAPELVTEYQLGDDGKFDYVTFSGFWSRDGKREPCKWTFTRSEWKAVDANDKPLGGDAHPLGECPVLIFVEGGEFPHFGAFAPIADLSRRLYNAESELDEILRSQTFSLLTMQVPNGTSSSLKVDAAQTAGETISTNNLLVHEGSTPQFIAPPDGPAKIYIERIDKLRDQIDEIGLNVATINRQESGIAMRMRFATINAELSRFSARLEDLERRAWSLSAKWLGLSQEPSIAWPRDFNIADVEQELTILGEMRGNAMPESAIAEQEKRIVATQFGGIDQEKRDRLNADIDTRLTALE